MKITKTQLKQIIKEELSGLMEAGTLDIYEGEKMSYEELRNRVHKYLIDEKFFKGISS